MIQKTKAAPRVTIRVMRVDDIDGVLAIDRKLRGPKRAITYSEPISDYIGGEVGISCVARIRADMAGLILGRLMNLYPQGTKGAWIEVLGVDPDYQGHGIGVKLVKAFETQCRKKGAQYINALTLPKDNVLKPFFESQGFIASKFIQLEKRVVS